MSEKFKGEMPPQEHKEGYSADFVARVKEIFKDQPYSMQALEKTLESESGIKLIGKFLDDARHFSMNPEEIIKALEGDNQKKVFEVAKRAKKAEDLYREWLKFRQK